MDRKIINISNKDWKDKMFGFILELTTNSSNNFPQQILKLLVKHFGYRYLLFFPYRFMKYGSGSAQKDLLNNFISYNFDYKYLNLFASKAYKINIFNPAMLPSDARTKKVITVRDLMDYEEYENSEWCKNLRLTGVYYQACIHLLNKDRTAQVASLNIFNPKEEGDFTESEVQMFEYLSDFLSNMFHLNMERGSDAEMQTYINGALKNLTLGVVFLDDQMLVLEANSSARELCGQYLSDFNSQLLNRSALSIDRMNYDVQRVVDEIGIEVLNGQDIYENWSANGVKYVFYPTSFITHGTVGTISHRYLFFMRRSQSNSNHLDKEFKKLTKREKEVLGYVIKGCSNEQICETLHVSIYTVRTHISNLYHKFDVKSRVELLTKIK